MNRFEYISTVERDGNVERTNVIEKISSVKNDKDYILPTRATSQSAGYDFYAPADYTIEPGETVVIPTGIKVQLWPDQFLQLHVRSSFGLKRHLILPNCTGIIDADYYNNPNNEGEIIGALTNIGTETQIVKKGEAFMQGIILSYYITDDDRANGVRIGGIGSTDDKEKA